MKRADLKKRIQDLEMALYDLIQSADNDRKRLSKTIEGIPAQNYFSDQAKILLPQSFKK